MAGGFGERLNRTAERAQALELEYLGLNPSSAAAWLGDSNLAAEPLWASCPPKIQVLLWRLSPGGGGL